MKRHVVVLAVVVIAVLSREPSTAQAQAWDVGRNMFGFAQYYPGSGWSSFYHPDFDPQAFFPTTFGFQGVPGSGQVKPYAPVPAASAWRAGTPAPRSGPGLFRRRRRWR